MLSDSARSLKSIVFNNCNFNDFDAVVTYLPSTTLKTLIVIDGRELSGYRCHLFLPEELKGSKVLNTVTLDTSDIRLASPYHGSHNDFVQFVCEEAIPESVEVLIFTLSERRLKYRDVAAIDDALVNLIQSKHCKALKEIHLELMEGVIRLAYGMTRQGPSGGWFCRTFDFGEEKGIKVFTECDRGSTARCISKICCPLFGFCLPVSTSDDSQKVDDIDVPLF